MYSRIVTALIATTALMLGGCASEPETKLEPGQKAFVFESGVVPIGDFDPYAFEIDELFDPCNEINDEEFARAGFTGKKLSSTKGEIESPHGTSVCTFDITEDNFLILASVDVNRSLSQTAESFLGDAKSKSLPEMYLYRPARGISPVPCYAQIDTIRGAIAVLFDTLHKNYSHDDMCEMSSQYLGALYLLNQ